MSVTITDEIQDYSSVTSSKLYLPNSKTYHPHGLMSEQIFGPVRDYTCQCGTVKHTGERCSICGVEFIKSEARDVRESTIKLPFRIIAPQLFYLILKIDNTIQKDLDVYKLNMQRVYDLVDALKAKTYDGPMNSKVQQAMAMLDRYPHYADIREILVIPPNLRPTTGGAKKYISDEINHAYQSVLEKIEAYHESAIKDDYHIAVVLKTYYENIYIHEIINKISTKEGYIRQNMLGKRVDFSGRTVIVSKAELPSSCITVPYRILIDLLEPYIYYKYPNIMRAMDDLHTARLTDEIHPRLKKVVDEICFEDQIPIIINRQPTLHRMSMRSFIPIPTEEKVVGLNPIVVDGFNADFDGDQMALHVPLLKEEIQDFAEKFINHRNQIQPGQLTFSSISQFSYSVYMMTKDEPNVNDIKYTIEETMSAEKLNSLFFDNEFKYSDTVKILLPDGNEYITTFGRLIITVYTGSLVNRPLNKGGFNQIVTKKLVNILNERHLEYKDLVFVDELLHKHLLHIPISISLRSLTAAYENPTFVEKLTALRNSKSAKETKQLESELEDMLKTMPELINMQNILKSGAKGGFSSLKQLLISKGFVVDALGNKVPYYINSSFVEGLSYNDIYYMSFGTRKGSLDRSVSTATTGYFMRKLVFALQDATVDYDADCGAEPVLEVVLTEDNYKAYILKYFKTEESDELICLTYDNYKDYLNKRVKFRSQIACTHEKGYCGKCFGNYKYVFTESKNVGIIASQALGERITQLIMRVFHTGGVVEDIRDEINHDYFEEIMDEFLVVKEFTIESIDYDEYTVGEEIDVDLYITTTDGDELLIPKGSIIYVDLKPEMKITKKTKLFSISKSSSNSVTNIFDAVLLETESPEKSNKDWKELYSFLLDAFYYTEGIISTHLETLVTQMMRNPETNKPARLTDYEDYYLMSIKKLPLLRTILTFGYQNFHANLIKSLIEADNDYELSILEKLIIGVSKKNLGLVKDEQEK